MYVCGHACTEVLGWLKVAWARAPESHSSPWVGVLGCWLLAVPRVETHNCAAVRHFYSHAGWAQLMEEKMRDQVPLGVVGQIIPWNFPLLMLAWCVLLLCFACCGWTFVCLYVVREHTTCASKQPTSPPDLLVRPIKSCPPPPPHVPHHRKVAPAIAMGNTLVIKPAPQTRLSAWLFAELCAEAGLPPGVVNVVTGDNDMAAYFAAHDKFTKVRCCVAVDCGAHAVGAGPHRQLLALTYLAPIMCVVCMYLPSVCRRWCGVVVAQMAFTGSTPVGKMLRRNLAGTGKKISLELGGKSPIVVYESADLDSAVEGLVNAIWFNQGQVCCAGSRLLVQESVADKFLAKLKRRMQTLRVGPPLEKNMDMGSLVRALIMAVA